MCVAGSPFPRSSLRAAPQLLRLVREEYINILSCSCSCSCTDPTAHLLSPMLWVFGREQSQYYTIPQCAAQRMATNRCQSMITISRMYWGAQRGLYSVEYSSVRSTPYTGVRRRLTSFPPGASTVVVVLEVPSQSGVSMAADDAAIQLLPRRTSYCYARIRIPPATKVQVSLLLPARGIIINGPPSSKREARGSAVMCFFMPLTLTIVVSPRACLWYSDIYVLKEMMRGISWDTGPGSKVQNKFYSSIAY
jgi:hypothetical protein